MKASAMSDALVGHIPGAKLQEARVVAVLTAEKARFDELAVAAGLPWLDRQWAHEVLIDRAGNQDLPRILRLNAVLEERCRLSEKILVLCRCREDLFAQLLEAGEPCLKGAGGCSEEVHRAVCARMEEVDHYTDAIVALVQEWRRPLAFPLPFIFQGDNYLVAMLKQHAPGCPFSLLSNHIKSVCRMRPFLYLSPYDFSVPETLLTHERSTLVRELHLQVSVAENMLSLARAGLYAPLLRHGRDKPRMLINNKRWRDRVILCYAGALHDAQVALRAASAMRVASQFVECSARALHLRYLRQWTEWTIARRSRKQACEDMAAFNERVHLRARFGTWARMRQLMLTRRVGLRQIFDASSRNLLGRCMRRWFFVHKGAKLQHAVRRLVGLRYLRRLQFLALRPRLRRIFAEPLGYLRSVAQIRVDMPSLNAVVAVADRSAKRTL